MTLARAGIRTQVSAFSHRETRWEGDELTTSLLQLFVLAAQDRLTIVPHVELVCWMN